MQIIVVGAGAAGLMAAFSAARSGNTVTVIEKNDRPGIKLGLTGNGRCNLTHVGDPRDLIGQIPGNGRFLYSALHQFGPEELRAVLNELGVPTKVEDDGRVFPVSDRALDVITAFEQSLRDLGVRWQRKQTVKHLCVVKGAIAGVELATGEDVQADAVIVCTGGASYPKTGSSGDGYRLAREVGHKVEPLVPSLVPLESADDWVQKLQGLALRNIQIRAFNQERCLGEQAGDLIFTHYGLSGPAVLLISKAVAPDLLEQQEPGAVSLSIVLRPEAAEEAIEDEVQGVFAVNSRKAIKNALEALLPGRLVPTFLHKAGLVEQKPVHQVTREERRQLVGLFKDLRVTLTRPRPLAEAIVTAGGVSTREINPKTMGSKLLSGLYFAGEVVDVDGLTGGYNLQAAFSMGYLAGKTAESG